MCSCCLVRQTHIFDDFVVWGQASQLLSLWPFSPFGPRSIRKSLSPYCLAKPAGCHGKCSHLTVLGSKLPFQRFRRSSGGGPARSIGYNSYIKCIFLHLQHHHFSRWPGACRPFSKSQSIGSWNLFALSSNQIVQSCKLKNERILHCTRYV